ncbi:MAG: hypothetical protein ACKVOK_08220 [Flavobacteriales bacterium]
MKNSFLILCIISLVVLASCRKDREKVLDNTFASDNSTAENLFNDVYKVVDDVSYQTDGIREDIIGCIDTIIVDTISDPRSITIDFGTDNCVGADGRIRNGILFVTYTGRYRDAGTVITITPQNYTVNGYGIGGTKTVTNQGVNDDGQPYFSVLVQGTITAPGNAWTSTWNSSRTRTWLEGYNTTGNIWDDVYSIDGSANGVNRYGNPYSIDITTPLRAEIGCAWLVSGILEIAPENADTRVVNFGSGSCNNGFTVTVNGETEEFNGGD